jgi:hypothetical protein
MSASNFNDCDENLETVQVESPWRTAWQNNKGATLILISEAFGSSADAIVRFLQQGGHGMYPFQVCIEFLDFRIWLTIFRSFLHAWPQRCC